MDLAGSNLTLSPRSSFIFLPAFARSFMRQMLTALKPGGLLIIEAFTPAQLQHSSGGPKQVELLYTAEILRADFAAADALEFLKRRSLWTKAACTGSRRRGTRRLSETVTWVTGRTLSHVVAFAKHRARQAEPWQFGEPGSLLGGLLFLCALPHLLRRPHQLLQAAKQRPCG